MFRDNNMRSGLLSSNVCSIILTFHTDIDQQLSSNLWIQRYWQYGDQYDPRNVLLQRHELCEPARRDNDRAKPVEPADRFYSFHINAAATAVLHPGGTPADWRSHPTTLYFYDPFETCTVFLPSPRFGGEGMGVRGQAGGHSQC